MLSSSTGGRIWDPQTAHCPWYDACGAHVPGWVRALLDDAPLQVVHDLHVRLGVWRSREHALVVTGIPGARQSSDRALEDGVRQVYASLLGTLQASGLHPLRFWNAIPGLLDPASGRDLNRYMVFNAGRAAGYEAVYTRPDLPRAIAAASGVGTAGDALLVGCLAGATPGVGVENPRQVPAYRYSPKFGPRAPSFARGTIMDGSRLLIAGTAAVRGEQSVALDDFDGQLAETIVNLTTLIEQAAVVARRSLERRPLACLTTVRVYVVHASDQVRARKGLEAAGIICPIETAVAALCRPELLVEVEGVGALRIEN